MADVKFVSGNEEFLIRKQKSKTRTQYIFNFKNYYGASVVKSLGSYGYEKGLWELAVLNFRGGDDNYELDYDTPITDDVLGYLTEDNVRDILEEIKKLKWN